jgi:DNA-binding response OmpR family regulator
MMRNRDQAILIIENDDPGRALYLRELSQAYRVFLCTNEREALALIGSEAISAVVLEPALEGGSGWELLSRLSGALAGRNVPIILCSTLDERRRGLLLGATVYLVKPILPALLLETLRRVMPPGETPSAATPLPRHEAE